MFDVLERIYMQHEISCIYHNKSDVSKFCYGHIVCLNEDEIVIRKISSYGQYDGFLSIRVQEILRVEIDSKYMRMMKQLYATSDVVVMDCIMNCDKPFVSLLMRAMGERRIVSIELLDSGFDDMRGFVDEMQDNTLKIIQIDDYGCPDGASYINLSEITSISYDGEDEQKYLSAYRLASTEKN